jgi:hypothetical protein
LLAALLSTLVVPAATRADEIHFLNGDRISGTITSAAGGKLTVKTDVAGEVTVDLSKVKTFSTTEPVVLKVGDATVRSKVSAGPDGSVQVVPITGGTPQPIALKDVVQINPPPVKWTGALTANALITRGNSETETVGTAIAAVRRSEIDRITLAGAYNYGRERDRDTGERETTINNWFAAAKYDYFLTKQFYTFGAIRIERDEIAELDLRVTPSVGVGYQWFETPTFNLNTEVGIAWVYESFSNNGTSDHFAARLAYHVDYKPAKPLLLFHNLEWLPSFEGPFNDYNLNLDAGLRAQLIGSLFAEMKVEYRLDATPAPGVKKSDVRYLFGVGWSF